MLPNFASAWLAFDGFSPESARGPHTPNLLRAREKWRNLAPSSDDDLTTTAAAAATDSPSQAPAEDAKESATGPCEWVPITLLQRPGPGHSAAVSKNENNNDDTRPALTLENSILITSTTTSDVDSIRHAEHATDTTTDDAAWPTPSLRPAGTEETTETVPPPPAAALVGVNNKMNRRERILHLARQNARTPLPEPTEEPQPPPPPPSEAEKLDEESERRVKERTIRDRLWRLVGRNY